MFKFKLFFGLGGSALERVAEFDSLSAAADFIDSGAYAPSDENDVYWFIPESGVTEGWGTELGYTYVGDRVFEYSDCPDGDYTVLETLTV